jgi:hypothetical protein
MGKTRDTGFLTNGLWQDASNNIGIGGSPSGSYKFEVTGNLLANGTMTLGNDGTYGSTYKTLGFTGNSNGSHRIFAGTADDLYIAAATGRGVYIWTDGTSTTRMRILANGNVGIGTSSPTSLLTLAKDNNIGINTVDGSDNGYLAISGAGADGDNRGGHIYLSGNERGADAGTAIIASGSVGSIQFRTGASIERMRITSTGNVGIGTSSPTHRLDVFGDRIRVKSSGSYGGVLADNTGSIGGGFFAAYKDGVATGYFGTSGAVLGDTSSDTILYADGTGQLRFWTGNVQRMYIRNDGYIYLNSVTYNSTTATSANMYLFGGYDIGRSTSSARYKTEIENIEQQYVNNIYKMQPRWYRSLCEKDVKEHSHFGFVAEEMAEIEPRLVHWFKEEDGELRADGVQYDRITALLVKAMQEQKKIIDELSAKVSALENKS